MNTGDQMLIRNYYEEAFNSIKSKYGEQPSSHVIPANISLEEAIGYTRRYVIESLFKTRHYRYGRYRNALDKVLKERLHFSPTNRRVVNLDLGCGPGLFSWVVRDYMLEKYGRSDDDIRLIGYDYAKNMIRLANLFKEYLPMEFNLDGYSEVNEIKSVLKSADFSGCDVIVTFGHVLVQTKGKHDAVSDFCNIICSLFPANCCVLVAVDAISRPLAFRDAWKNLRTALQENGVNMESEKLIDLNSMCARLSMGERDGGR